MNNLQQNVMPQIDGKPFRCPDCSCNVFHETEKTENEVRYACNGCGSRWIGEKLEQKA